MKWIIGISVLLVAIEIGLGLAWAFGLFENNEDEED